MAHALSVELPLGLLPAHASQDPSVHRVSLCLDPKIPRHRSDCEYVSSAQVIRSSGGRDAVITTPQSLEARLAPSSHPRGPVHAVPRGRPSVHQEAFVVSGFSAWFLWSVFEQTLLNVSWEPDVMLSTENLRTLLPRSSWGHGSDSGGM